MKLNARALVKGAGSFAKKHGPSILTGFGIALGIATTTLAVMNTPKAMKHLEVKKAELNVDKLNPVETVKTVYKDYIPAAVTGAVSVGCLVGATAANSKQKAALAAAYALTTADFKEYKNKVVEKIGEKKEQEIHDAVAKDRVDRYLPVSNEIVEVSDTRTIGRGNTRCFDYFAGGFFWSDIQVMDNAINEIGRQILSDGYASLNDFYEEIGRSTTQLGDAVGWTSQDRLPQMRYSSCLAKDGQPYLSVSFNPVPEYDFDVMS